MGEFDHMSQENDRQNLCGIPRFCNGHKQAIVVIAHNKSMWKTSVQVADV